MNLQVTNQTHRIQPNFVINRRQKREGFYVYVLKDRRCKYFELLLLIFPTDNKNVRRKSSGMGVILINDDVNSFLGLGSCVSVKRRDIIIHHRQQKSDENSTVELLLHPVVEL